MRSVAILLAALVAQDLRPGGPTEPQDAAKTFRIRPGFRIELVAAEPLVIDPVDMAFDEDGRLFVAEMIDYPYGETEGNPPQGRIRLLEDDDGDGRFDRSFVYADRLRWPTSVALWDGGVLVASPPEILYFKDTDGDRRADRREVVLTGFGTSNVQGLVNNLKWGLDNAFHGATSSSGGRVRSASGAELDLRGRDFRFTVNGGFEALSGGGLFGNTFDDFGRRFVCRNWYPVYHVVLKDADLRRNPHLAIPSAIHAISPNPERVFRASPPEPWRERITRMFLSGQLPGHAAVPTGRDTAYFTSASGTTLFRGTALGDDAYGTLFVGEAATNLVHQKRLLPDGATFRTERVDREGEFLVSTDNWFRPVNFAHGPDGALYICDMYRQVIEHPAAIPEVVKRELDLTVGKDRGRIWRVTREGATRIEKPRLGKATTSELVEALRRPDAWWRETVGRLLFQRQDRSAAGKLEELAIKAQLPATRVAALWALEGLAALRPEIVERALRDPSPDVREQAVRLAKEPPAALVDDPSPRVRFQLACTLRDPVALARLAARDGGDPWMRIAILSSSSGRAVELLRSGAPPEFLHDLALTIGARNDAVEIAAALALARESTAILTGLGEGLRRGGRSLGALPAAAPLLREAERIARDDAQETARRVEAVRLLAHGTHAEAERCLVPLLDVRHAPDLRTAAARSLARFSEPAAGARLVASWKSLTPAARPDALAWFARPARFPALLEALEQGKIAAAEIGPDLRRSLLRDALHGTRARKLLGEDPSADRRKVVTAVLPALDLKGDATRGREVYRKLCATCHRAGSEGREAGPDLSTVLQRTPDELLVAILDPNREVNPQFLQYKIRTKAGDVLDGIIAAESASSVTLRRAQGEDVTVLRADIEVMASADVSLMPEGLEKGLEFQNVADLLAFIRAGPGDEPLSRMVELAPTIVAVARPHQVARVGEAVTLDGSKSWSAAKIVKHEWSLDGGVRAEGARVKRVYERPGTYSEVLKVTDSEGRIDYDFGVVMVFPRDDPKAAPPTLHPSYFPTFGLRPGDPVTFKVRTFGGTDGDETWDFGDGTPTVTVRSDGNAKPQAPDGYAPTVHRFARAGHYVVRVERTARAGVRSTAHLQVRVGD